MLSICIPIYNHEVGTLTMELHRQASELNIPVELQLLDDDSDVATKKKNRPLDALPFVKYAELPENVGRSKIRNLLAKRSSYQYLLFIDCDMQVRSGEFLDQYTRYMQPGKVVCGGHRYRKTPPEHPELLHWLVGSSREVKPAAKRRERPHCSFMTANFMTDGKVLSEIGFREELNGYGHEDTLMGYALHKAGIPVHHIDNPLYHNGLEPAPAFLEKTEKSIDNLWRSYKLTGKDPVYARMVTILRTYFRLKKWGLATLLGKSSGMFLRPVAKLLRSRHPSLQLYDLYKLCLLCRIASQASGDGR